MPLGLCPSDDGLQGLMTLKSFLNSGYDMGDGKILVCVRSVGPRKAIQLKKREGTVDLIEVGIFDDTATCVLKLWGDKVFSAKTWVPNQTILLISTPTCRISDRPDGSSSADIGVGYNSMVDIDPIFPEADWLRKKVKEMSRKERVLTPFPKGIWDVEAIVNGPVRELFTLSEVDDLVRQDPSRDFTGKINVVILEMNLLQQWFRSTICCCDCCNVPIYSKRTTAICKTCGTVRQLGLNPRVVGNMVDESGSVAAGKLAWSDDAWTQLFYGPQTKTEKSDTDDGDYAGANLFGQTCEDLTALDSNSLRDIEDRMLFARVTLTFGWFPPLERMCILGVEW
ncbi:uncharacterized protein BCR38DRAFT_445069 [Pseudomassariella vexata]|uniref:Uncharacterized protein n=1 Tax=Pseudomassariella vexata TaxID=1141098 RepID=A0A1Y2DK37_9PEZI|nr:uncharacterized protein BCR38DRAFT_445069 [Pseudomassariella vexata]ORY59627.1 hypothetical protein BCR38DRAFT_445069 [Pseudomassariella vexata]